MKPLNEPEIAHYITHLEKWLGYTDLTPAWKSFYMPLIVFNRINTVRVRFPK